MGRVMPTTARAALAALFAVLTVAANAQTCEIVDAFTPALDLAASTAKLSPGDQANAFAVKVIGQFPDLYDPQVLGLPPGPKRAVRIVASLDVLRKDKAAATAARDAVTHAVPGIVAVYAQSFPDFHCDFPVYLFDSLGQLDGAGRVVGGKPSLVLGIDQMMIENSGLRPVLLAHEFFHRYHAQAGAFSDDPGEGQPIWRVLWAEGLATYVSMKLTPGATLTDALILPADLETQAKPKLADIVARLKPRLDKVDPATYRLLFTYGGKDAAKAGLPWRSGYYAGYLVAAELGKTRSLTVLAHMRGQILRKAIEAALTKIAATGGE
jgi:uncharacterized protein YjaZ